MYETTYTVTFVVNYGTNPVEGANINFNSQDILTDETGKAVFNNVPSGNNMPFTITKSGYASYNGTLNVSSNIYQTISLTTVSIDVILTLSGIKISPNPFKDFTAIEFYTENNKNAEISIYSYLGQLVKTIKKENLTEGNHRIIWDASDASGKKVSQGIYFVKIKSGNTIRTAKIILAE